MPNFKLYLGAYSLAGFCSRNVLFVWQPFMTGRINQIWTFVFPFNKLYPFFNNLHLRFSLVELANLIRSRF